MKLRDIKTVRELDEWGEKYGSLPRYAETDDQTCIARLGGASLDGVEIHLEWLEGGEEKSESGCAYWKSGPTADESVEVYADQILPLMMAYDEYAAAVCVYEKERGYSARSFAELQADERAPSWYGPPNKEHHAWRARRFGEDAERGARHLAEILGTWGGKLSPEEMQGWMCPARTNVVLRDGSEVDANDEYLMIYDDGRVAALNGEFETKGVLRADCLAWCLEHLTWIDRFGWKMRRVRVNVWERV